MGERHVRIEISDFVMRTFVPTGTTVLQGGIKNACNVLTCMDTAGAYFAAVKCKKAGTIAAAAIGCALVALLYLLPSVLG